MSPIPVSDTQTEFTPHPEGQYEAVCVDVIDHGWLETEWGHKHKVSIVFFCGKNEGEKILTVRQRFTASLHEKSRLRPFLQAWRGRPFTLEELGRFDLEHLLKAPAYLQIEHSRTERGTYANIASIMRLPAKMEAPAIPPGFVRTCDRPDWPGPAPQPGMSVPEDAPRYEEAAEEDLPF
jgi:hypothetical protein